jgi:hypothetical protein
MFDMLDSPYLSTQTKEWILKACIQPRMIYLARITPPEVLAKSAKAFDERLMECYILNCVRTPAERAAHDDPA